MEVMTLSVIAAAEKLGIGRQAMRKLIAEGKIGAVRYGKRPVVKVPTTELERFVAEQTRREDAA